MELDRENRLHENCKGLILAVSGGGDSMAMLHAYANETWDFPLYVAHVHHGLRPESDEEAVLVEEYCSRLGIDCKVFHTSVKDAMQKGETVESAARRLRYGFFKTYAQQVGATHLATAHTLDDQCETVLLHLIHGSGAKGLCGISPLRKEDGITLIRPLLQWEKRDILQYCTAHSIPFVNDPSNEDLSFTRNRIRHVILPEMEKINPNLRQTVGRTAEIMQHQQQALTQRAEEFLATYPSQIPADRLTELPRGEQAEILRSWFESKGKILSYEQTEQALALLQKPTGTVEFDRRYRLHLGQNQLTVTVPEEPLQKTEITSESTVLCDGRTLTLSRTLATKENRNTLIPAILPLTLRPRREGDKIGTAGGTKTLKKRLIELKIPQPQRDRLWVLTQNETLLWCEQAGVNQKILPQIGEEGYFISLSEQ